MLRRRGATEHVAAADDRGHLDAFPGGGRNLLGDVTDRARGDPEWLAAGERLAGQLQHHAVPALMRRGMLPSGPACLARRGRVHRDRAAWRDGPVSRVAVPAGGTTGRAAILRGGHRGEH